MSREVAILLEKLPPYQGKKRLIKTRQYTDDIINDIMRKHRETISHYDSIAEGFWKGNTDDTAQNLYYFAKKHLPYQVEPTLRQTSKTPAAILEERNKHGNDCKQYASWCVGIGEALRRMGHPVKCFYRFASYNKSRSPGHVFAVFVDENGKEIWVDPVPETGGYNKRYIMPTFQTDKMPPMSKNGKSIGALYDISGLPSNRYVAGLRPNQYISEVHWLDTLPTTHHNDLYDLDEIGKAKKKKAPKKHHKGIHIKLPHIKIQPGKLLKKVSLTPARNAYLLMVKLNTASMATDIHNKVRKHPENWKKLSDKWRSLGGDPSKLNTAIDQGVKLYNKLHPKHKVNGISNQDTMSGISNNDMMSGYPEMYQNANEEMIGIVPVVAGAAAVAAAAPIILALKSLLQSFGVGAHGQDDIDQANIEAEGDHNNATDAPGDGNKDTNPDGSVDHGDGVTTKVTKDANGNQVISYDVKDPTTGDQTSYTKTKTRTTEHEDTDGDGDEDTDITTKEKKIVKHNSGSGFMDMVNNVKDFVADHKWWFIGGGLAILSIIVIPKVLSHSGPKPRRR